MAGDLSFPGGPGPSQKHLFQVKMPGVMLGSQCPLLCITALYFLPAKPPARRCSLVLGQWTGVEAATGSGVGHTGLWSCSVQHVQRTSGDQSLVMGPRGWEGDVPLPPPTKAPHLGERCHRVSC